MTSKPLRFHPQAEQEYLTALAWYRERSLIAAINFESTFEQAVNESGTHPNAGLFTSANSEDIFFGNFLSALSIRIFPLKS